MSSNTVTRASLLVRLRARDDSQAWGEFDAVYRPVLHRFARARGLTAVQAEDLAQECMATIARHMPEFRYDRKKGRFRSWLFKVAETRLRNHFRGRRLQQAPSAELVTATASGKTPAEVFERIWLEEHLGRCLVQLRDEVEPSHHEAFCSYVIEERPVEEVCRRWGLTVNQLYKIKWRLTQKLADRMRLVAEPE